MSKMAEEKDIKVTVEDQDADAGDKEANEHSPLNSKDASVKSSKERLSKAKPNSFPEQITAWLDMIQSNPQYRKTAIVIASCLLVVVLLLLVIVIAFVVRDPLIDPNYRYLRLIPTNNEPKNTIRFSVGELGSWHALTNEIDSFLAEYNSTRLFYRDKISHVRMDCNDITITANFNRSCFFNADEVFSLCSKRDNYGYSLGSPCVFLKFNNILGWVPEVPRDETQVYQLPPTLMRMYNQGYTGPYVNCEPNTAVDRENLGEKLKYAPATQEMPPRYFPYLNQINYMSPLVAVKFERPARNIYIGITCRLWAVNLDAQVEGYWYKPSAVLPFHIYIE